MTSAKSSYAFQAGINNQPLFHFIQHLHKQIERQLDIWLFALNAELRQLLLAFTWLSHDWELTGTRLEKLKREYGESAERFPLEASWCTEDVTP